MKIGNQTLNEEGVCHLPFQNSLNIALCAQGHLPH
jgi:hypothetical protein